MRIVLALVLFLGACAVARPIRLGPGECVVISEGDSVVVAGAGCEAKRLFR